MDDLIGTPNQTSWMQSEEFKAHQAEVRKQSEEALRAALSSDPIRVLIADDQDIIRSGFRLILSAYPQIEVVGEAKDGEEALSYTQTLKPDVVLMDIRMPRKNGIEATRSISANPLLAQTHVLILTTFDVDEYVYDALSAGASGFMLKDADSDEIVHAIEVVAAGEALIQPSVMKRLVESFVRVRPTTLHTAIDVLTEREREILTHIARGLTNDEIAEIFVISPATVKTHVARIMSKLGAHDRAQLVVIAYENGLVIPGSLSNNE